MRGILLLCGGAALVFGLAKGLACYESRRAASDGTPQPVQKAEDEIPSYSKLPPQGPLPATIAPDQFDDAATRQAYAAAAAVKSVLYQLPCYCHCDRTNGHRNLMDCFTSYHAASCWACQREAVFARILHQKGHGVEEIRAAILKGDWRGPDK